MIYGESAGAGSMSVHFTNKNSWPYFSKIALESGSMTPWVMQPMNLAQTKYNMVLEAAGCEDSECLKNLPASQLSSIALDVYSNNPDPSYTFWSPVCDGVEATTHPWFTIKDAAGVHDVPMMHGTNTDEGAMFTVLDKEDATDKQLRLLWSSVDYLDVDKMEALYVTDKQYPTASTGYSPYWYAGERSVGDINFVCPDLYTANTISEHLQQGKLQNAKSYIYHFEHISGFSENQKPYVDHAAELPYTFHFLFMMKNQTADLECANLMSTYWGNFIISSSPQVQHQFGVQLEDKGIAEWSPYSADKVNVHAVEQGSADGVRTLDTSFKKEECDYLIPLIENKIRKDFAY